MRFAREVAAPQGGVTEVRDSPGFSMACNAYASKHGPFAEMVREHYRETDDES